MLKRYSLPNHNISFPLSPLPRNSSNARTMRNSFRVRQSYSIQTALCSWHVKKHSSNHRSHSTLSRKCVLPRNVPDGQEKVVPLNSNVLHPCVFCENKAPCLLRRCLVTRRAHLPCQRRRAKKRILPRASSCPPKARRRILKTLVITI